MQSRNLHIEIWESILSTTKTIPTKAYVSSISSVITAMEQVVHIDFRFGNHDNVLFTIQPILVYWYKCWQLN